MIDLKALTLWLELVIGGGAVIAGFVSAIVAVIKTAAAESLPARYYPILAVVVGILVALFISAVAPAEIGLTWRLALLVGAFGGVIAAKLFTWGKHESEIIPPHG